MLTSLPPSKGISTYSTPLLKALGARADLSVEALSFKQMYPSFLYPGGQVDTSGPGELSLPRVTTKPVLHWANPFSWIFSAFRFSGEILHAQWWSQVLAPVYITVLAIARLRRRQVVLTIHNVDAHEPSAWKSLADSVVAGLADHFIVHTKENAEALQRRYPQTRDRVSVVPMGTQDIANRRGLSRAEARDLLGLDQSDQLVLFFGNIRPYKGLDDMMEAFASVKRRLPNAKLLIVGQPWGGSTDVEIALTKARSLPGCLLRLEYVTDEEAEAYFAACDVAAFPYKGFEAQSGAGARAVSFRRAMIVTDAGGLKTFVRDQRAVVPSGAPSALADALTAVLQDVDFRDQLESDAELVARQLDWGAIADQTVAVYRGLLRENQPAMGTRGLAGTAGNE